MSSLKKLIHEVHRRSLWQVLADLHARRGPAERAVTEYERMLFRAEPVRNGVRHARVGRLMRRS